MLGNLAGEVIASLVGDAFLEWLLPDRWKVPSAPPEGEFYDLLCTVAYPDLSPTLAMKIARHATLEEIRAGTWPSFAVEIGMAAPYVRRRVAEIAEAVGAQLDSIIESPVFEGLDAQALAGYVALISSRAERIVRTTQQTAAPAAPPHGNRT